MARRNPPISASDLKVLRRILAVHERDNRSRRGKGKKRRNPTRAQKQARAYANAHKIGLRGRSSLKRSRRATKWALKAHRMNDGRRGRGRRWNPGRRSSGLYEVMARAGKRWYKTGSKMSKEDAQREKNYQLRAELNGHKVTTVYIRPAR
jgi:hypothetical protein